MKTVVTGVIGVDAHIIGNRIVQKAMEGIGLKVVSLGALTPAEEFIGAAVETDAAAIAISSLYGQAEIDCLGFRGKCLEAGLDGVRLYIGGNLMVGAHSLEEARALYMSPSYGFDRVYPAAHTTLEQFLEDVKRDLGLDGAL